MPLCAALRQLWQNRWMLSVLLRAAPDQFCLDRWRLVMLQSCIVLLQSTHASL